MMARLRVFLWLLLVYGCGLLHAQTPDSTGRQASDSNARPAVVPPGFVQKMHGFAKTIHNQSVAEREADK
ncbi:hypothetical protein, partial [Chitinophaga sp.]|uniref:hypothetical protein n=1 Tax=Chitinophaga sp. TaxID=1869181 RepID=UPI002F9363A4